MTLVYIDGGQVWHGEAINDVRHPLQIESLWTTAELADIGLEVFTPPVDPIGRDLLITSNERDRRIALGAAVTLSDSRTFSVDTRNDTDFRNINGLATKSALLLIAGDTTTTLTFRDSSNVDQVMTAGLFAEMAQQVGSHVDNLYKKSWLIKDAINNSTWSGDITDDANWS